MSNARGIARGAIVTIASLYLVVGLVGSVRSHGDRRAASFDEVIEGNARQALERGRQTFRFDTFGDQAFWGDLLRLHEAIAGSRFGGQGPGLSPRAALGLGLKVDIEALTGAQIARLERGRINLDDPAVTLALLRQNAVIGVKGFFRADRLQSVGIQCALCHSVVDNALAPGVGRRLDGWANRDLDVGKIVALAPNLQPFADLLGVDVSTVKAVLASWGPGKFDAELILDGKAFRPDGKSAATLIPPAFGLAGVNLHTWTGWGSVTHWNGFVSVLEMHGKGTFYDPRLNDADRFPVAARAGFGNVRQSPDLVTAKLADLHLYQLAIPAPRPPDGSFDERLAQRGQRVFEGKGKCATCHVPPLFTEPGWNMHTPEEIGIDDFQANRSPDGRYRTAPLKGLWTHTKGGFYHDGRFATLRDVVNHYDGHLDLNLTDSDKRALVEYLRSLSDDVAPVRPLARESDEASVDAAVAVEPTLSVTPSPAAVGQGMRIVLGGTLLPDGRAPSDLEVAVFDVTGRRVAARGAGIGGDLDRGELTWDGRDARGGQAAPGVYFVRVSSGSLGVSKDTRVVLR